MSGTREKPENKANLYLAFKSALANEMHLKMYHQICDDS